MHNRATRVSKRFADSFTVPDGRCETLRFWESPVHFVVLGRSGKAEEEVVILSRIVQGLRLSGLEIRGSDILYGGRKVSGNAQRRTRGWLLHHGTLLCGLDAGLMERLLREPRWQPRHRDGRPHREFVTTLPLGADELKRRVTAGWAE